MNILEKLGNICHYLVKHEENLHKLNAYLIKYGYLNPAADQTLDDLVEIITIFQDMAGLTKTGIIDGKLLRVLDLPRCACKDNAIIEKLTDNKKWAINRFRYYIASYDSDYTKDKWNDIFAEALSHGKEVCNVDFTRVLHPQEAHFIIEFGREDGNSGTLAWQELPPTFNFNGQLKGLMDRDENWLRTKPINVIRHELMGHGLGLSHSKMNNQLLSPFYSADIGTMQSEDISRLQKLYGKSLVGVPTPTVPPTVGNQELVIRVDTKIITKLKVPDGRLSIDGFRVSKIG